MTNNDSATITFRYKHKRKSKEATFNKGQLNDLIKRLDSAYNKDADKYSKKWDKKVLKEKREKGIAETKKALINAKKQYNKDYNSAYNYSAFHPISQFVESKNKLESDKRWNKAFESAKNLTRAENAYKKAKQH
jgi:hypothetical protein